MLMVEDVDLTPNPHALKFILNKKLLTTETRQYPDKESAQNDPFAKGIFEIEGVASVFYMDKFVTIEKTVDANWGQRPALAGDGGGLEVVGIDGYTVKIRYQGACGTCPSAISGTLMAIEGLLRRDINQALEVVAA
jgi:Fe-S cluster biogenesis protein NfuA